MKKSKFIQSTIILMIGGMITKVLGMLIRIITSRTIGKTGMGIYSLLSPTFMLLITFAQLGFPIAISKLVAEDTKNNKKLVLGLIPISLFLNICILILLFNIAPFLSKYLLHEKRCTYAILCMGFVLPFISLSSILRGYFFGKERVIPHVVSNIVEDVLRIFILIVFLPLFLERSIEAAVCFLVFSNLFSELASIFLFLSLLPKKGISLNDFKPKKQNIKSIFSLSIPLTGSRIIGNIGYFLEPIILTSVLTFVGYSNTYIVDEYGIISGFVLPIVLLPSFFTGAISQALLPVISKSYSKGDKKYARFKIKQAIFLSVSIGILFTIFLECYPHSLLQFMYHTKEGSTYLQILAPFCLLHYIQAPIASSLQAIGKAKISMRATCIGTISRIASLLLFSFLKIGLWPIVIANIISMLLTTSYEAKKLRNCLR